MRAFSLRKVRFAFISRFCLYIKMDFWISKKLFSECLHDE